MDQHNFQNWSDEEKWQYLTRHEKLGELLVTNGLITVEQLEKLLDEQKQSGKHIGQLITAHNLLSADQILAALDRQKLNDRVSLQSIDALKLKKKDQ